MLVNFWASVVFLLLTVLCFGVAIYQSRRLTLLHNKLGGSFEKDEIKLLKRRRKSFGVIGIICLLILILLIIELIP
jgi:hypothetical protein